MAWESIGKKLLAGKNIAIELAFATVRPSVQNPEEEEEEVEEEIN